MGGCACKAQAQRREVSSVESIQVEESSVESIETKSGSLTTLARVNQYRMETVLGTGSFGAVYRASDSARGDVVAIKVMDKTELRKKTKKIGKLKAQGTIVSSTVLKEIAVMKRVRHANCACLFEVIDDPLGDRIFLVMELLVGGEVMAEDNLPAGQTYLDEWIARSIFRDLLDGLEYLHGNGILHRDIKPENIVYSERPPFSRGRNSIGAVVGSVTDALTASTSTLGTLASATVGATFGLASGATELASSAAEGLQSMSQKSLIGRSGRASGERPSEDESIKERSSFSGLGSFSGSLSGGPGGGEGPGLTNRAIRTGMTTIYDASKQLATATASTASGALQMTSSILEKTTTIAYDASKTAVGATVDASRAAGEGALKLASGATELASTAVEALPGGAQLTSAAGAAVGVITGAAAGTVGAVASLGEQSLTSIGFKAEGGAATRAVPAAKLLDFGISQLCADGVAERQGREGSVRRRGRKEATKRSFDDSILKATGTPPYFAPEMLAGKPFHGRPADVWASGVTLAYLVTGEMPFWSDNVPEIWRRIKKEAPKIDSEHLSAECREILTAMLHKDPAKRPTLAALRQHAWVTDGGSQPMPEQTHLLLEVSDLDVHTAVQKVYKSVAVQKCAKKWRALPARNKAARAAAAADSDTVQSL